MTLNVKMYMYNNEMSMDDTVFTFNVAGGGSSEGEAGGKESGKGNDSRNGNGKGKGTGEGKGKGVEYYQENILHPFRKPGTYQG